MQNAGAEADAERSESKGSATIVTWQSQKSSRFELSELRLERLVNQNVGVDNRLVSL